MLFQPQWRGNTAAHRTEPPQCILGALFLLAGNRLLASTRVYRPPHDSSLNHVQQPFSR